MGLPNQGVQILYEVLNERDWILAERSYAVWPDMERVMREDGIPQFTVDGHRPVGDFDLFGISFSTEICYTNVLTMLDLGGIPLHADDRGDDDPLVIAGGPGASRTPSCVTPSSTRRSSATASPACLPRSSATSGRRCRAARRSREDKLARIASVVERAYVPRFYEPLYGDERQQIEARCVPATTGSPRIRKHRVIDDLDGSPLPTRPIVPFVETAHDRIAIEIMRGCPGSAASARRP